MFIPIPEPELEISEEQKEQLYWQNYIHDSHRWVEFRKGYYQCSFCLAITTNQLSYYKFMCEKNPHINNNRIADSVTNSNTTKP